MQRAVQTLHKTAGAPIASIARQSRLEREERVFQALSKIRWAQGPLALVASDLADLEDAGTAETITSLIQLAGSLGRRQIVVLNLEFLVPEGSETPLLQRVNALQWVIRRISRNLNLSLPRFTLEERGSSLDLRVDLRGY